MAPRTVTGSKALGSAIRDQRFKLGMTIEEAASRAGTGAKTWGGYENGASIRADKVTGICRTLRWKALPPDADSVNKAVPKIEELPKDQLAEAWSPLLEEEFGARCARTFAEGSLFLLDHIDQDIEALGRMPAASHVGQLDDSWVSSDLPQQFLTRYDYEFIYRLRGAVKSIISRLQAGTSGGALHSVLEELAFYLSLRTGADLAGISSSLKDEDDWQEWFAQVASDLDLETFLYSSITLEAGHAYHFDRWTERQFWSER